MRRNKKAAGYRYWYYLVRRLGVRVSGYGSSRPFLNAHNNQFMCRALINQAPWEEDNLHLI
ncbi:hypothetical protein AG1IA_05496 [Rhizoctonia solani AG-1 IA]|uniref:Uncharacterized protein n=1 Tax=Thanatephorus cucumeris (strain AG1-IA) TaxID=983506 RepID=L8WUP2_THACA|nr:hypothetical protein AG1IA_05496 [Rhizoctonia solani AG-1 IA]